MASRTTKPASAKARGRKKQFGAAKLKRPGKPSSSKPSLAREIWLTSWGIIGILAGLVFFAICLGFWYGSGKIVKIIEEINERDFTVMSQREELYEKFFNQRDDQGYRVTREKNKIFTGVVTYMWRIQPPGSSEIREFGWEHDLETNTVNQITNGALLLDLQLEIISEEYARTHEPKVPRERYNPEDSITYGIVQGDLGSISKGSLSLGWDDSLPVGTDVIPPLLSPQQASNRKAEQEMEASGNDAEGQEEDIGPSEDVVVITPAGED